MKNLKLNLFGRTKKSKRLGTLQAPSQQLRIGKAAPFTVYDGPRKVLDEGEPFTDDTQLALAQRMIDNARRYKQPNAMEGDWARELQLGKNAPFDIYGENNELILPRGEKITSFRQLDNAKKMIRRARDAHTEQAKVAPVTIKKSAHHTQKAETGKAVDETNNPFILYKDFTDQLERLYRAILAGEVVVENLSEIATRIYQTYSLRSNGLIATLLLEPITEEYFFNHLISMTILTCAIGSQMGLSDTEVHSLLEASLLSNIGLIEPSRSGDSVLVCLSKTAIKAHPERSRFIAEKAGIKDEMVLIAIEEHHEHIDGSGYPHGKSSHEINGLSKIIAVADVYASLFHKYCEGKLPPHTLVDRVETIAGSILEPELTHVVQRLLCPYPPGAFVRLSNGYKGIVTKSLNRTGPFVSCYANANGVFFPMPMKRACNPDSRLRIVELLPFESIPFDWSLIWGYKV